MTTRSKSQHVANKASIGSLSGHYWDRYPFSKLNNGLSFSKPDYSKLNQSNHDVASIISYAR